ncbi:MAG: ATP-binding protein [Sedimenticola sp.]
MLVSNTSPDRSALHEDSSNWEFRYKVLNSIMLIAMVFSFLFALLNDLGINDIGEIHSKVDYFYSFSSLGLLLLLRKSKEYFTFVACTFLAISFGTFISALIFVVNDEFRIIWFYFLIYVTYILLGTRAGVIVTLATLITILAIDNSMDLEISDVATYTAILGLLIASLLSHVYTRQMKKYEEQLSAKNIELEQKVAELDVALIQAQEASRAKGLFLANMSHEIRTPINGVLGMAQVLRGTSLDDAQKYYLDTLDSSSKTLLSLIDDLLDLSKIESGKIILDIEPFKTFNWVNDIINISESLFEDKQALFSAEVCNDLPEYLEGDSTRLLQIATNLISNAAKSTPEGEVKLNIDGQLTKPGQFMLSVSVTDTGIGISKDKLEIIFESFHQLTSDRTASRRGVGLGLAICKHLAKIMNGDIQVTSEPGVGSCFTFVTTLKVPDNYSLPKESEGDFKDNRSLSILLVDDDPINRLAARTLLAQIGHKVTEAENGQAAVDLIHFKKFDVILMDIHMPVMGGIAATQVIRRKYKNVPIIGLTASVMKDEKDFYLRSGMNAVVEKPILIDKLMITIEQFLSD